MEYGWLNLQTVMKGVPEYVNAQNIRVTVGSNNLKLSKRSISDILEKWVIDFLLTAHPDIVEHKSGTGYDFAINVGSEKVFVNIKTEFGTQEYSWLCSSSVLTKRKEILDRLYFYKMTYTEIDGIVRVVDAGIAGPLDGLIERNRVVIHDKGKPIQGKSLGKVPTHYNGEHCFLGKENFKSLRT